MPTAQPSTADEEDAQLVCHSAGHGVSWRAPGRQTWV